MPMATKHNRVMKCNEEGPTVKPYVSSVTWSSEVIRQIKYVDLHLHETDDQET